MCHRYSNIPSHHMAVIIWFSCVQLHSWGYASCATWNIGVEETFKWQNCLFTVVSLYCSSTSFVWSHEHLSLLVFLDASAVLFIWQCAAWCGGLARSSSPAPELAVHSRLMRAFLMSRSRWIHTSSLCSSAATGFTHLWQMVMHLKLLEAFAFFNHTKEPVLNLINPCN